MNPCMVSFFMSNINPKTIELQKKVVEKFNKSEVKHYIIHVDVPHALAMDYFWGINGYLIDELKNKNVEKMMDHDAILFLDIDCIPLHEDSVDLYLQQAYNNYLVGNIQRSNHLDNNQHVFAAPSALALTGENFVKIGMPSAYESKRSDVAEEYTWAAEKNQIPLDLYMPMRYDSPPQRYAWEGEQPPYWALADGMPVYGMGTTYGRDGKDLFYHNFQIRMPGQQERFWQKCEEVLNG